ncbi:DNA-processing protein DprA [Anaeromyxobacter paludicola]|uniref:DNA polymerase n=1 Tax=Anaeromyxobacter paludicola TaxID=2918171 RepID=A0ABN6N501_9BACT|nr:DNA-processing protein DprA [Anaeromyxobacter paludicola]BDG08262.1 DNA polymerase [Anaeromyxobacter paludicola]
MGDARTILRDDPGFPARLRDVPGAPAWLRVRGELGPAAARRVAVVGSRHSDEYGLAMARALGRDLARAGATVVSGGADGVDAAAHEGALAAGGHTVAVLGCGVDVVYPPHHAGLFDRILAGGGALCSEYADGAHPARSTFPQRNRIVSGMSEAVVVVRCRARSGALITAACARRQGVPLFAVPGQVGDPLAEGPLGLLRDGARVATSARDVLAVLGIAAQLPLVPPAPRAAPPLPPDETALLAALGAAPRHAEQVATAAGLLPGAALAGLLSLELQGLCEQRPGNYFLRREDGSA